MLNLPCLALNQILPLMGTCCSANILAYSSTSEHPGAPQIRCNSEYLGHLPHGGVLLVREQDEGCLGAWAVWSHSETKLAFTPGSICCISGCIHQGPKNSATPLVTPRCPLPSTTLLRASKHALASNSALIWTLQGHSALGSPAFPHLGPPVCPHLIHEAALGSGDEGSLSLISASCLAFICRAL